MKFNNDCKEEVIVEYLPLYKKYRVWNSNVEEWFNNWEDFVKCVEENDLLSDFRFVSYSEETQQKLIELERKI